MDFLIVWIAFLVVVFLIGLIFKAGDAFWNRKPPPPEPQPVWRPESATRKPLLKPPPPPPKPTRAALIAELEAELAAIEGLTSLPDEDKVALKNRALTDHERRLRSFGY